LAKKACRSTPADQFGGTEVLRWCLADRAASGAFGVKTHA
jgi:hypothetical protein